MKAKSLSRWRVNVRHLQTQTLLFTAAAGLILPLLAHSTTFAGSATWNSSGSTDWNTNANWTPTSGYPGTTAGDTATFNNLSSVNSLFVSANTTIAAISFNASETHAFTISADPTISLTLTGTGITNSTVGPITQNFVTVVDGSGDEGGIVFNNSATAGSGTVFSNTGSTFSGVFGGFTVFNNTSTAGSRRRS
jgi:hypothetical protein